jgi:hypothetical protein
MQSKYKWHRKAIFKELKYQILTSQEFFLFWEWNKEQEGWKLQENNGSRHSLLGSIHSSRKWTYDTFFESSRCPEAQLVNWSRSKVTRTPSKLERLTCSSFIRGLKAGHQITPFQSKVFKYSNLHWSVAITMQYIKDARGKFKNDHLTSIFVHR